MRDQTDPSLTLDTTDIEAITRLLRSPMYIALLSHRNPDGDALGSSLAMKGLLSGMGHQVDVLFPSPYPDIFDWMPGASEIKVFDQEPQQTLDHLRRAQLAFTLDFNALDRIDKMGVALQEMQIPIVMIDHHIDPEPFADYVISDSTASSTAELVYIFMEHAGYLHRMNIEIGSCLYTGLLTDTGSFRHATTADTYRIAGELKRIGIDDLAIHEKVFDNMSEQQLRLLGHCLANRMEILEEYQTAIITLTRDDYSTFNIQRGDTEGIVNYLLKMPKIKLAAFITEQPKIVKISLRSRGDLSVQKIASEQFKGGGHFNASGGSSYKPLGEVVKKFKRILPEYILN